MLGQPGTQVVIGEDRLSQSVNQGGGLKLGSWLDYPTETWAVEGSFFYLAQHTVSTGAESGLLGFPLLGRPVVDAGTGTETVLFVSAPGAFAGGVGVTSTTAMLGAEMNLLWVAERCKEGGFFNVLGGLRYLQLRDDLDIAQSTQLLPEGVAFFNANPLIAPTHMNVEDNIATRNDFWGGQLGIQGGWTWWLVTASLTGKLALGNVQQTATVNGTTTVISPLLGKPQTTEGGLLALPTNIGTHVRNAFAVLPTAEATVTFEVTSQIHLLAGYTFLYVSDVARPGDQIDRQVNRNQLPTSQLFNPGLSGPSRPEFTFNSTNFWAQGLTLGISFWF